MPTQLQYTVRGVPAATDKELRRKAKRRGISFNQLLVEELVAAAAGGGAKRKYRDVAAALGGLRLQKDPEFDKILAEQRQIDPDLWK